MGKPYQEELGKLDETYRWALQTEIESVVGVVADNVHNPLVAVGSGGSFSTACFAASIHEHHTGKLGSWISPLHVQRNQPVDGASYVLISAGGNNRDILAAFRTLISRDANRISVMVGKRDSRLGSLARRFPWIELHEFDMPAGADGFLATNSLMGFCTILARAYLEVFRLNGKLPSTLEKFPVVQKARKKGTKSLDRLLRPIWDRRSIVVLHSVGLHPGAVDLESRFTEAALGNIQTADFRQFGHGRHNWLAKHGGETAVLALVEADDEELAARTLRLLPDSCYSVKLEVSGSKTTAMLGGMLISMFIAGTAGEAKNIDPGRPGIPRFGRDLYNLSPGPLQPSRQQGELAILRKTRGNDRVLITGKQLTWWRRAYASFCHRLSKAIFGGIALDYDGTLCDRRDRFRELVPHIGELLESLLCKNILVRIATGRGKSVRESLRTAIPKRLWNLLSIGYYNGAQIGSLADDQTPQRFQCCEELTNLLVALQTDARVSELAHSIEPRGKQISIQGFKWAPPSVVRGIVEGIVEQEKQSNARVVWSTHSVDVLASGVSKLAVVRETESRLVDVQSNSVLCIGDLGRKPGNDYELLSEPYSLSVDEVSDSAQTCWNLAPAGCRGVMALMSYFGAMQIRNGSFRFDPTRIRMRNVKK